MENNSSEIQHIRREAARRARLLAEAGRVARMLEVLLQRADALVDGSRALTEQIGQLEQAALLRAHGRVESRRRFKHRSGHPLHEGREASYLFFDECGLSHAGETRLTGRVTFESQGPREDALPRR